MTVVATTKERAKAAWQSFLATYDIIDEDGELTIVNCIDRAIRAAENDVIERIATIYETEIDFDEAVIRSLKHKDP